MGFEDTSFFVFLAAMLVVYYAKPLRPVQVPVLVLGSLFFYGYGQPYLLILLVACACVSAGCSFAAGQSAVPGDRWRYAAAGVAFNLLILCLFKYEHLLPPSLVLLALPLPIGISFYTFHGISLVVDSYRGGLPRQADGGRRSFPGHLQKTFLYLVFFPQLIAGPISKAQFFWPQIASKSLADIDVETSFKCIVYGFFLKSVVANNLQDLTAHIQYPHFLVFSSLDLVVLLIGYSAQIFADFAGYSLLAIGFAGLFGYRLPRNFDMPYVSQTFSEFWSRWHISLSSFLREYLYYPLGGNRRGEIRTYANLMTVMVLGGLWHGAAISYAVWGACHGAVLVIERLFRDRGFYTSGNFLLAAMRTMLVFAVVTLAWLLFKLPDFNDVLAYLGAICTNAGRPSSQALQDAIWIYALPVALMHGWFLVKRRLGAAVESVERKYLEPAAIGLALAMLALNTGRPSAFIYFQF